MFGLSWLDTAVMAVTAAAAAVALRASMIRIRDSLDTMEEDMSRQGRWQQWGAGLNALATAGLIWSQILAHQH